MPTITSGNSASSVVTLLAQDWWLKDPADPTRNQSLFVEDVDVSEPEQQGQFDPLSRGRTITVRGNVLGDRVALTLLATKTQAEALDLLRSGQRVLFLQSADGDTWYVNWGKGRDWSYASKGSRRFRRLQVEFTEAEKPA